MAAQHANFHSNVFHPVHIVNQDRDPQDEFNWMYNSTSKLLDAYNTQLIGTVYHDSCKVHDAVEIWIDATRSIKKATALAVKISVTIKIFNSAELSRVYVPSSPRDKWSKVRQPTRHSNTPTVLSLNSAITADM